jgi:hypothetical protein
MRDEPERRNRRGETTGEEKLPEGRSERRNGETA